MYPGMYFHQTPPPHPAGYRVGYLLVGILSAALVLAGAYGFRKMTDLSFLIGFLIVAILHTATLFFLRSQPIFEQMYYSGWDRVVSYTLTALFSVAFAAYGLYCLVPAEISGAASIQKFMSDTLIEPKNTTLGCWVVPVILEIAILLLVLHNRRRFLPYPYVE